MCVCTLYSDERSLGLKFRFECRGRGGTKNIRGGNCVPLPPRRDGNDHKFFFRATTLSLGHTFKCSGFVYSFSPLPTFSGVVK